MRRLLPAALIAAVLAGALAACGGSEAPKGFTRLGEVDGVPVYVDLSKDRFTVQVKLVDDVLSCEGSTGLRPDGITELCNTQTPTTYVYAAAFPKKDPTPRLCDDNNGDPAEGKRLKGKADWPFDVVAAVGEKATWVTVCPDYLMNPEVNPTP